MSVENLEAAAHQFVVVRLVARGVAQVGEAGPFGDGDPDFGRQDAFHVERDDALLHKEGVNQSFSPAGKPPAVNPASIMW